jgi:hypothetical protein
MFLREIEFKDVEWIHVAQDMVVWYTFADMVTTL